MLSKRGHFDESLAPICALCRKEVDSMRILRDPPSARYWHTRIIIIHCHGKRREMRVTDILFYSGSLKRGIAFIDELSKRLPAPDVNERIKQIEQQYKINDEV